MIKKTVAYKNPFDGTPSTKDCWFHLYEADVTKLAMIEGEGMDDRFRAMIAARDTAAVLSQFEKLVAAAYGLREGDDFLKSPEITQRFMSSAAYSALFIELITTPNAMEEFANGLMPKDFDKFVDDLTKSQERNAQALETGKDDVPAWISEGRTPTNEELKGATPEQLQLAFARKAESK